MRAIARRPLDRREVCALRAHLRVGISVAAPCRQDWPAKQITIVVPFGAGGSADLLARILATHMQAKFGQTVVVENRAGAGGSIGTNYVAKAAPDGYTLLLGTVSSIAVERRALRQAAVRRRQGSASRSPSSSAFRTLLIVNPKLPINERPRS